MLFFFFLFSLYIYIYFLFFLFHLLSFCASFHRLLTGTPLVFTLSLFFSIYLLTRVYILSLCDRCLVVVPAKPLLRLYSQTRTQLWEKRLYKTPSNCRTDYTNIYSVINRVTATRPYRYLPLQLDGLYSKLIFFFCILL